MRKKQQHKRITEKLSVKSNQSVEISFRKVLNVKAQKACTIY